MSVGAVTHVPHPPPAALREMTFSGIPARFIQSGQRTPQRGRQAITALGSCDDVDRKEGIANGQEVSWNHNNAYSCFKFQAIQDET